MDPVTNAVTTAERGATVQSFIMHHVADGPFGPSPSFPIHIPGVLTHHGFMVVLSALLLVVLIGLCCRKPREVPSGWYNLLELFVQFIRDHMAVPHLGAEDGRRFTPLFCSFFAFVLTMNLLGLLPIFHAATANVNVTGALASVTLGFMVFGAMFRFGPTGFVRGFIPHGVPWPVLLLLVPIEILGLVIKSFALMIRLFANMLAGHLVIFSLLGLVVTFGLWALPAVPLAMFVYLLEVMVCFLQAYIFTLLSAIFIGQRLVPEH